METSSKDFSVSFLRTAATQAGERDRHVSQGACRSPPKVLGGSGPEATGPKTGVQRLVAARGARRKHQVFSETSRVALFARS